MAIPVEQGHLFPHEGRNHRKKNAPSPTANELDGKTWLQNSISIWSDISKTPQESALNHPAIFPTKLAARLIACYTRSDQSVILDPFCGIGSTVIAAQNTGKLGIGTDISADYIAKASRRPNKHPGLFDKPAATQNGERRFIEDDARNLLQHVQPESVDFVVTSPPYWDILLRERTADYKTVRNYGDSDQDLGRISDYSDFLDSLAAVFTNVFTTLKPGCYCCVVVSDLRKGSSFYPLHADLAAKMQHIGFRFDDIIIWDRRREYNNLRPLGHPSVFRINKVHEYILIFQKPRAARD